MNAFQLDFYSRLRAWNTLKENLSDSPIDVVCIETDKFWQQCPE